MWLWRQLTRGMRSLFDRDTTDRELADEVRHFIEEAEADLVASGRTPAEARRAVRLRYGDGLNIREDVRSYGWENVAEDLYADLRLAVRRLRRSPGFTAVAVLTLGLGIGASTAIFSAVHPVLFEPLGYPDADRVLAISDRTDDGSLLHVAFGTYRELSQRSRAFEALAVFKSWQPTMTGGQEPERIEAQQVSAGYFDVLGVQAVVGSGFDPSADVPGGGNHVIISDRLWRSRFDVNEMIVGTTIRLDSEAYTVVGVMPPGFGNVTAPLAQAWSLLQYDPLPASFDSREWGHHLSFVGRSRAGVELEETRRSLQAIAGQPVGEFPRPGWADMGNGFSVRPLRDAVTSGARPTMLVLLGAVALILTIACVNLTVLLLGRGSRRRGEFSMRTALGAGRARLVRQLLTESVLLSALGGALGLAVAHFSLAVLVAVGPVSLGPLAAVGLHSASLYFAVGLTTVVGVMVGLAPALTQSESRNQPTQDSGHGTVGRRQSTRHALVVVEVAFAIVLLVGAGLLLRSTQRLFSIPPGFDASGLVVMQVHATGLERGDATTHRFFDGVLDAVRAVPGVGSVVLTNQLPLSGEVEEYGVTLDVADRAEGTLGPAYRYSVTPGYFETMGIGLLSGRGLEGRDTDGLLRVAVVSESLASRLFRGRDPIGERIRVGATELPPYTVVGVVENVSQASLEADQKDAVYVPSVQWHWADRVRWLVVKADHDPLTLAPAIRSAVWSVDANQPIVRTQSMQALLLRSEAQRRFVMIVLVAFALFAGALAAIGLYGVLAQGVSERMREMGVRAALGASPEDIVALVVSQGMTLTAAGIAIGLVGAAVASEVLVTLLFGVSRVDPATYLVVVALSAVVACLACFVPAVRAARVDPLTTLGAD